MSINCSSHSSIEKVTQKEEGFSSLSYLGTACAIATVAGAFFSFVLPEKTAAIAAVASWYLFSATVIQVNTIADGTSLEKPTHLLYAVITDVHSAARAIGLFPFTLFNSYHAPQGNLKGQPILLVHGYLCFGSIWNYQRKKLIEAGFGPIYTMNIGSGKSIKTYAKQVQEKVKAIQKETQRNDLILIGHSKGGLVSSYYATHLATPETEITDLITIGSPLAGAPIARIAIGKDGAEMRVDADFHKKLRDRIEKCSTIRFAHIASASDPLVPLSSALLPSTRQWVLKDMGHIGLLFSSRVADQIGCWLNSSSS